MEFLKPRTGFEFAIVAAMAALLVIWGVKALRKPPAPERSFAPPEQVGTDLLRIHRAAEEETARDIANRMKSRGCAKSIAAVYELVVLPDKPVFYLGAGEGTRLDRRKTLDEEMRIFRGKMRADDTISDIRRDSVPFLCASFQCGSGLVALSAICVWDDGQTSGFGLRIAGGDIQDTLQYTAEARKAILHPPPPSPFDFGERPATANKNESQRDRAMRDIVASLRSYNCRRFNSYLPSGAEDMFRERIGEELLDRMKDPVERVCFVLSTFDLPRSETMTIREKSSAGSRFVLTLQGAGSKPIDFPLMDTANGWKVDADWALKQVQDHKTKMALLTFAMNEEGRESYRDPSGVRSNWVRGIADQFSETGKVYISLSTDNRRVCGSAISLSGELFMIRLDEQKHATYTRGASLPSECPEIPFSSRW